MKTLIVTASVGLGLTAWGAPALADERLTPAAQEPMQRAEDAVRRGDYLGALQAARASLEIQSVAATHLFIARTHQRLGQIVDALGSAQRCLREATAQTLPATRSSCSALVNTLSTAIGRVTVSVPGAAAGVTVQLEGRTLSAEQWSEPVPVTPGDVQIVATDASGHRFVRTVAVSAGETARIQVIFPPRVPGGEGSEVSTVGWLVLQIPAEMRLGLRVQIVGATGSREVSPAEWDAPVQVLAPGQYRVITSSASGTTNQSVSVPPGESRQVTVFPSMTVSTGRTPRQVEPPPSPPSPAVMLLQYGLMLGGLAGIGYGAVLYEAANTARRERNNLCPSGAFCPAASYGQAASYDSTYRENLTFMWIWGGVGAAAFVTGGLWWLFSPRASSSSVRVTTSFLQGPMLGLEGTF